MSQDLKAGDDIQTPWGTRRIIAWSEQVGAQGIIHSRLRIAHPETGVESQNGVRLISQYSARDRETAMLLLRAWVEEVVHQQAHSFKPDEACPTCEAS